MQVPQPLHVEVLLDYLFFEEPHLRGLMLRSQMGRIQPHIRNGLGALRRTGDPENPIR